MKPRSAAVIFAILLALLLAPVCLGQGSRPSDAPAGNSADLVNIFFTVRDGHSGLVPNLTQDSFQIKEDGRPQTIQRFAAQSDAPLTVGVLIETSGAMQVALSAEKAAAGDFFRKVVTEKDLGFAISFDITVDLLQDLTGDLQLLRSGLGEAKVNVGLRSRGFNILLHDAVYLAANEILRKQVGRKALVILTSGVDQGSKIKLKETIQAAQRADAVCYVLLFARSIFGQTSMNDLAEQTGGRVITVRSAEALADALRDIAGELHSQYSLSYAPGNSSHDGSFHAIEITSKEGYKIHTRKGYFAAGSN